MSDEFDRLLARMDEQIKLNMACLSIYSRGKAERDYQALTFEKQTGEALL